MDFIRQDIMPIVREYDRERADYLADNRVQKAQYLFPNLKWHTSYYSENRFREHKALISEVSGVDFTLKMFRATLTTLTVNGDLSRLPAMGMQLRQASPDTIRKFYADIERANVGKQLRPAWRETPVIRRPSIRADVHNGLDAIAHRPPLIDFQNEASGCEGKRTRRDSNPRLAA